MAAANANPLTGLIALGQQAMQAAGDGFQQNVAQPATEAYREAIPANYRLFLSTALGDRSPITAQNFSPAELSRLRSIVAADQRVLPWRSDMNRRLAPVYNELASDKKQQLDAVKAVGKNLTEDQAFKYGVEYTPGKPVILAKAIDQLGSDYQQATQQAQAAARTAARAQAGIGAVRYEAPDQMSQMVASGYPSKRSDTDMARDPQVHVGPFSMGVDYGDRDTNAIANTLGQFVYRPAPGGGVSVDDSYDWQTFNQNNGKSSLAQAVMALGSGNAEPLIARMMPTRQTGRPVHIVLPPQGR